MFSCDDISKNFRSVFIEFNWWCSRIELNIGMGRSNPGRNVQLSNPDPRIMARSVFTSRTVLKSGADPAMKLNKMWFSPFSQLKWILS